ncbi:MAG: malonyl-CoA O-methyltransferase [Rickettsiales bacterium]
MKSNLKHNFNKAAKIYNQNAILQQQVAKNLIDFCPPEAKNSQKIIDLGSGTGFLYDLISQNIKIPNFFSLDLAVSMLKQSNCNYNINGDINLLPLKNNLFDLVISSLALQWIDDYKRVFEQIHNILSKDGLFCFSIIAKNSLNNINNIGINNLNINQFPDQEILKNHLKIFSSYKVIEKKITIKYDNYYCLLQSIKKIGAGYSVNKNYNLKISDLKTLMNIKNISENWNIIYVIAKK